MIYKSDFDLVYNLHANLTVVVVVAAKKCFQNNFEQYWTVNSPWLDKKLGSVPIT